MMIAIATLATSGCGAIGLGIGAAIDSAQPERYEPAPTLSSGDYLRVTRGGQAFEGELIGVQPSGAGRMLVLQSPTTGASGTLGLEPGTTVEVRVRHHGWRTGLIIGVVIDVLVVGSAVTYMAILCESGCPG